MLPLKVTKLYPIYQKNPAWGGLDPSPPTPQNRYTPQHPLPPKGELPSQIPGSRAPKGGPPEQFRSFIAEKIILY